MMRFFVILVGILGFLASCKKDKLNGEYSVFKGRWVWSHSSKNTYHPITQSSMYETIYATDYADNYELEFIEKGKVRYLKNGDEIDKKRIVFSYYQAQSFCGLFYAHEYRIDLNNDEENYIHGCVKQDTLTAYFSMTGHPLSNFEDGSAEISYIHYYLKE